MRLRICHEISASFDQPVASAIRTLRMTPRTYDGQYVVDWRIDVDHDCRLSRAFDSYGNIAHDFFLAGPLDSLVLTAVGEVETDDTAGVLQIGERLPVGLFLRETRLTTPDAAIRDLASDMRSAAGANPLDRCHALMKSLHGRVKLRPLAVGDVTCASDETAASVLAAGSGSPAGVAHLFVTAARVLGIPARLVSGYAAFRDDDTPTDAAWVWAEAQVAGLGWVGFDVAHDRCPTDIYVRVASGLDQHGIAFLRGANHGLGAEVLVSKAQVTEVSL
ncbi:transglutaminase family protein [Chthonobacter rhizosphaerae]|uniref:transglutaminase family protein n=1 Tax=Chthonobacter rhizosphaerae TaxID=2735553 RepID=UPI0015EEAB4A|nr:transglutaminase family protein [Chthonobacter rhizosphaerae]